MGVQRRDEPLLGGLVAVLPNAFLAVRLAMSRREGGAGALMRAAWGTPQARRLRHEIAAPVIGFLIRTGALAGAAVGVATGHPVAAVASAALAGGLLAGPLGLSAWWLTGGLSGAGVLLLGWVLVR